MIEKQPATQKQVASPGDAVLCLWFFWQGILFCVPAQKKNPLHIFVYLHIHQLDDTSLFWHQNVVLRAFLFSASLQGLITSLNI